MLAAELRNHGRPDPVLHLQARAERHGGTLRLTYNLSGPLETLRIPPPEPAPQRRDGLWQHTCLEAFLGLPGQEGYWELNLAPSGHWNLYRLDGYRRNLRPEPALQALPITVALTPANLELRADLPLPAALAQVLERELAIELGLSAVLEHRDGELSYWALAHPTGPPDFHWRGGWRRCP